MNQKLKDTITDWPHNPKDAVERLVEYYGPPQEFSDSYVIWHKCQPWKRTVVSKFETPHLFPHEHTDFVEQCIDYQVPLDIISEIYRFDGSVNIDRTRGEMSARCGGTSMNFVAINLAHDLIQGNKTLEGARDTYDSLYHAYQEGKKPEYTQRLVFDLPKGSTNDPGQEMRDSV